MCLVLAVPVAVLVGADTLCHRPENAVLAGAELEALPFAGVLCANTVLRLSVAVAIVGCRPTAAQPVLREHRAAIVLRLTDNVRVVDKATLEYLRVVRVVHGSPYALHRRLHPRANLTRTLSEDTVVVVEGFPYGGHVENTGIASVRPHGASRLVARQAVV